MSYELDTLWEKRHEHEGHYAWEVEPFDPEGPVGIVISMADVECGQPLDATLVVLADSDDEREVEWARSTADDIAARLNEHQAQAATIAELQREIERLTTQRDKAETTLEMVKALADGYGWLAEGRGPYAYDDGRYDDDVRTFATQLHELLPSGNWLGFPEWEAKYRRMEGQIEGYRQALEHWICRAHRIGEHGEHQAGNPDCDYARRALGQI